MFRYKRGVKVDYDRQGYIYFVSRMYKNLPPEDQQAILNLCLQCGGEHYQAATALAMKHYLSKKTLYRAVRKYYENFPEKL